jgi:hypothetical protein
VNPFDQQDSSKTGRVMARIPFDCQDFEGESSADAGNMFD